MSDENITAALIASLRGQGGRFPNELREIEISLAALELRRAFHLMSRLRERGLWQPSPADAERLEDFWWEYGQ
jgi:hypothetical protein